jgi:hypothetical protein
MQIGTFSAVINQNTAFSSRTFVQLIPHPSFKPLGPLPNAELPHPATATKTSIGSFFFVYFLFYLGSQLRRYAPAGTTRNRRAETPEERAQKLYYPIRSWCAAVIHWKTLRNGFPGCRDFSLLGGMDHPAGVVVRAQLREYR